MREKIIITLAVVLVCLVLTDSHASLFKSSIPTGKEIKDPYLEQLFAPEFPYESVKVIETKEGKRYVVIKAKQKISEKMEKGYQEKTLRNRNIAIYRAISPHSSAVLIAKIRLSRKVSDKPYVIEYCEANPRERTWEQDIAWKDGRYFVLWVDKDFGKKFERLVIYPEKEINCTIPPHVGKYPNSLTLGCYKQTFIKEAYPYKKGDSRIVFVYISKDDPKKIYTFYKDKLLKHFENIKFNFPEKFWWLENSIGIHINHIGIDVIDKILGSIKEKTVLHEVLESSPLNNEIPSKGVIFGVQIFEGVLNVESLIQGYSWIEIYYDTQPAVIKEKIKRYGK